MQHVASSAGGSSCAGSVDLVASGPGKFASTSTRFRFRFHNVRGHMGVFDAGLCASVCAIVGVCVCVGAGISVLFMHAHLNCPHQLLHVD